MAGPATVVPDVPAPPRVTPDDVRPSLLRLVERFRPHQAGDLRARWGLDIRDAGAYTFHVRDGRCFVSAGRQGEVDATIHTDAATWLDLVSGRRDGIASFREGRLRVVGDLNLAVRFGTLFRPGPDAHRFLRHLRTAACGTEIDAIVAGRGSPVLLLHGLAASKVSFLPTLDGLADRYEVHALDLPGFGKSDKPLPTGSRYSARWMAETVWNYLRANGIRRAYLVGNSMGARIGLEVALRHPDRIGGLVGLGAAVAFDEYQRLAPFLRLVHSQWVGMAPFPVSRAAVRSTIDELFADPACLPPANLDAAADEFLRCLGDRRHRLAILACARHIAGERGNGRGSFWQRLEDLRVPSYWIWGGNDRLSSSRYAERVRERLPAARVEVWPGVGHVPQFEVPARTNDAIGGFFDTLGNRAG